MGRDVERPPVATRQELLEFWTRAMRDEDCKITERIKASELMAKVLGVFEDAAEAPPVRIVYEGGAEELAR